MGRWQSGTAQVDGTGLPPVEVVVVWSSLNHGTTDMWTDAEQDHSPTAGRLHEIYVPILVEG